MKFRMLLVLALPMAAASMPADAGAPAPAEACAASFTTEGNFMSGTTLRASLEIATAKPEAARKNIAMALLTDGWTDPKVNEDLGAVTANQSGCKSAN